MIPKKHAPDLIGGGNRFSDKIMRNAKCDGRTMMQAKWVNL